MGILIIVAACAAVIMAGTMAKSGGQSFDLATIALIIVGFSGACALGIGFINTWRTPMLTVQRNVGISFVGLHLNTPNIPPPVIQDSPLVDSLLKRRIKRFDLSVATWPMAHYANTSCHFYLNLWPTYPTYRQPM